MYKGQRVMKGRQALWIIYDRFRLSYEAGAQYDRFSYTHRTLPTNICCPPSEVHTVSQHGKPTATLCGPDYVGTGVPLSLIQHRLSHCIMLY